MSIDLLLITFGSILLVGLGLDAIGQRTRLPRITLLVAFGVLVGPTALDLLPVDGRVVYPRVAEIALTMIAFLVGGDLTRTTLIAHGRGIIVVSLCVVIATVSFIAGGLSALGTPLALALLLAGVGLATDPAAVREVAKDLRADGARTKTTLGIVAIDDVWGLIAFSVILGFVAPNGDAGWVAGLGHGLKEIVGAVIIGLLVGLPGAFLTGRLRPGEPTMLEALGLVLLCAGLALTWEVSFLLAGMTAGAVIANLASHHERPFHEIEHISVPFMIVFFVLAGASADLGALGDVMLLAAGYIVLRTLGRLAGGLVGVRLANVSMPGAGIGLALTPQAGITLGMALVGGQALPEIAAPLLAVAVGTTVLFEVLGPFLTRRFLECESGATTQSKDDQP